MTQIVPVSQKEMEAKTGFKKALGYALPKEDKILVRKGLSKEKKKEVLAHEEDHIEKGEEGPFLSWLIPAAIGLFGASKSSSAAKDATAAQTQAGEREIQFLEESRDLARGDVAPYREAGYTALDALMSMTGLAKPKTQGAGGLLASGGRGGVVVNGVRNNDLTLGPRIGAYGIRQTALWPTPSIRYRTTLNPSLNIRRYISCGIWGYCLG